MRITAIKGQNMEMTDAIASYVDERLGSLEKLVVDFEPMAEVAVEVGKSTKHHNKGPHFRAEFTMQVPGKVLRAEEEAEDLYEAIDQAKNDLKRQITDFKGKLTDKHRKAQRPDKA